MPLHKETVVVSVEDVGSIPGRVIPKAKNIGLDTFLLNTHHYKVEIKDKVEQSRERTSAHSSIRCSSEWKGAFGLPFTTYIFSSILSQC